MKLTGETIMCSRKQAKDMLEAVVISLLPSEEEAAARLVAN